MTRLPDWRVRFDASIDAIRRQPFNWQTQHDCGIGLAARAVEAITGEDIAAEFRGRYQTRDEAIALMQKNGFDNLADLAASLLPEIEPSRAVVGDIVAFPMDTPFGFAFGVVNGERAFALTPRGIGNLSRLGATRAFKVG